MGKLNKKLGITDIFSIVAGVMISSGIFVLPGIAFSQAGPAVIFSYLLASLIYIPAIVCIIELATAMPKAGGTYFVIDRSLGTAAGTVGGFSSWLSLTLKSAFAIIGLSAIAKLFFPNFSIFYLRLLSLGFCLFFLTINLFSVKLAGRFQRILVFALIGLLIYYITKAIPKLQINHYSPFMPHGAFPVISTAGMVFISFTGVSKAASVAEETIDPEKTLPYGILLGYGVVVILYFLIVFVTIGILPAKNLSNTLKPIIDGARFSSGSIGVILMTIGAFLAFATTANAGIMAASRDLMAMSRDAHLPSIFSKINKKYNTPHFAIISTGISMILAILFLDLRILVKTASCMQIVLMIMVIISVIAMRESKIFSYKPTFRSPFYPYLHIFGIICLFVLLFDIGLKPLGIALILLSLGLFWFWIYTRIHITRKPALAYIVDRIIQEEIFHPADGLGQELKKIIKERDNIKDDFFDKILLECKIIDLKNQIPLTTFYKIASKKLASEINIPPKDIYEELITKESESSSVIRPGLAIPCIMLNKDIPFQILVARCFPGVDFSPILPPVYSIFILIASKQQRSLLMRSLVAISEITQNVNFDNKWLQANNKNEIRQFLHTSQRRRIFNVYFRYNLFNSSDSTFFNDNLENISIIRPLEKSYEENQLSSYYGMPYLKGFSPEYFIIEEESFQTKEQTK